MDFRSEKRLALRAVGLVGLFLALHLLGLRSSTGILSGTLPAAGVEILLGLAYVGSWFGLVLLAPILALAAALRLALRCALERARTGALGQVSGRAPRAEDGRVVEA